tara:strand:- start:1514 stop:4156 length:2643 start_codon:yes stop_codon:yes gene_type:complete
MAHGFLNPTDLRKERNFTGAIASGIGKRIGKASDMARRERAYASKKAEENNTSLEEAGVGKGYFFKRALGSTFGGDRIARTRGRFESDPPAGRDPTKNQAGRFRGGFDYSYSEQIPTTPVTGGALARVATPESEPIEQVSVSVDETPALAPGFVSLGGALEKTSNLLAPAGAIDPEILPPEPGPGLGGGSSMGALQPGAIDVNATEVSDIVKALKFVELRISQSSQDTVQAIQSSSAISSQGFSRLGQLNAALAEKQITTQIQLFERQKDEQQKLADRNQALLAASQTNFDDQSGQLDPTKLGKAKGFGDILGGLGGGLMNLLGGGMNLLGGGMDTMGGRYMRRSPNVGRRVGARRRLAGMRAGRATRGIGGALKGGLGRVAGKGALKGLGKGLGKAALKKIPVAGLLAAALFAGQRAMAGDMTGAGLELASGGASLIPGFGTAASVGIDALLAGRDMSMPQMASGGITDGPKSGYPVEHHGREITFSAEGPEAKKIFKAMGGGYLDAQLERKKDVAEIGAAANSSGTGGGTGRAWWDFLGWAGTGDAATKHQEEQDKKAQDANTAYGGTVQLITGSQVQQFSKSAAENRASAAKEAILSKPLNEFMPKPNTGGGEGASRTRNFIQGNTGNSRGDHFHLGPETALWGKPQGKVETRKAAFAVAKGLIRNKEHFTFTNAQEAVDPNNPPSDEELRKMIEREQAAHAARSRGGSFGGIDIAGRKGLKFPLGVHGVRDRGDGFGISGTISGFTAFVGHGMDGSRDTAKPSGEALDGASIQGTASLESASPSLSVSPTSNAAVNDPLTVSAVTQNAQFMSTSGGNAQIAAALMSLAAQIQNGSLGNAQATQSPMDGFAAGLATGGMGGHGSLTFASTLHLKSLV